MKKGQKIRVRTEDLISELLMACGWSRYDYVAGLVIDKMGNRICVQIDGRQLWFNDDVLEKDTMQPEIPGI
jgi:hypothetical protein